MLFTSQTFLFLFLPILILVYYIVPARYIKLKNGLLLVFSLIFYTWGEKLGVLLLLIEIAIAWLIGKLIFKFRNWEKLFLTVGITSILLFLVYFKYAGFITTNLAKIFGNRIWEIALPIGISFFSFQIISYMIDCYNGKVNNAGSLLNVALYVSMFPQLIAGPIVRYVDIEDQLRVRNHNLNNFNDGICRFLIGLSKKVLIANQLAYVHEYACSGMDKYSVMALWLGSIAYTLQIYFDFSGYSDMAIGLGKIFGFDYPVNFDDPYIAGSVTEFWKRWHMTLSGWFRDYVYIPLGGNRHGMFVTLRNMFIVWLLTGIWHGANWNFIVWGLLYFTFLALERVFPLTKINNVISHIYTLLVVNFCWVIFSIEDLSDVWIYIKGMIGCNQLTLWDDASYFILREWWITFLLAILYCIPTVRQFLRRIEKKNIVMRSVFVGVKMVMVIITFAYVVKGSYNPFIYFNF